MEGKIDIIGELSIKRGEGFKKQECPFQPAGGRCGDWCPQFGEPYPWDDGRIIHLDICENRQLSFTKFIDERK